MRGPRYACVRACAREFMLICSPKIMPIKPRVSSVSLHKCVFIYLSSFRKLGNWKPRGVYNQISTNIQAAHIQLLTRPEPTYTLRSSLAKHHVDDRRATKIMLQSQLLARHSRPTAARQPHLCLCCAAFGLGGDSRRLNILAAEAPVLAVVVVARDMLLLSLLSLLCRGPESLLREQAD